jgi:hypothetical protein
LEKVNNRTEKTTLEVWSYGDLPLSVPAVTENGDMTGVSGSSSIVSIFLVAKM